MSQFALKGFSHVRPARPAFFFKNSTALDSATERRLQQEDRLIALGLVVCFLVQGAVLLLR